jgi:8-oxo-dGTP pyrophosphatase MutT (NUDIX family)
MSEPAIALVARRTLAENTRFTVCFDDIVDDRGHRVENFLSVLPRARSGDGVTGIAVLPVRGEQIGMMHMYRHPYGGLGWEIPMGFIDGSESPVEAALREMREETGLRAQASDLQDLGLISPAPSVVSARIRLYAASVQGEDSGAPADEAGHGRFEWFAREKALRMASDGAIVEPCTLISLYRYVMGPGSGSTSGG